MINSNVYLQLEFLTELILSSENKKVENIFIIKNGKCWSYHCKSVFKMRLKNKKKWTSLHTFMSSPFMVQKLNVKFPQQICRHKRKSNFHDKNKMFWPKENIPKLRFTNWFLEFDFIYAFQTNMWKGIQISSRKSKVLAKKWWSKNPKLICTNWFSEFD